MKVFKFKLGDDWYAYAKLRDALDAKFWFIAHGYMVIGRITYGDESDFQFKMNATGYPNLTSGI